MGVRGWIREYFRRRLGGCPHDFQSTGLSYTDDHGVTIVLRACTRCPDTILIQV